MDVASVSLYDGINPNQYDVAVSAVLVGIGAEKYIDIFRKKNIGQDTLIELSDEDLIKLGVDEENVRERLIKEIKNLPIYEERNQRLDKKSNLGILEIVQIFEESSLHLYRISLALWTNTVTFKKAKDVPDCLLYKDKYASDIAITTLSEINKIVDSMDDAIQKNIKIDLSEKKRIRGKKIFVGTFGAIAICLITTFLVQSIKKI